MSPATEVIDRQGPRGGAIVARYGADNSSMRSVASNPAGAEQEEQHLLAHVARQGVPEGALQERLWTCGRVILANGASKQEAQQRPAGLTPRTVQHIHATLRTALDQAVKWDFAPRNVAMLVDAPRVRRAEVKPFTPDKARKFLDAAREDRLEGLYAVAMLGLRQGEILGLRWPDINLVAGTVSVRQSLQRVGGKLTAVDTKTDRSRRSVRLPQVTAAALVRHQARQQEERQSAGSLWKENDFVFTTTIGTPMDGPTVTHRFQNLLQSAGLPRMRFHDLRHTCATLLLAQGVHPRVVMEILGHSQIAITMNLYSHVIPAMQEEVATRLDEILSPPQAPKNSFATSFATNPPAEGVN
jgi:integrase